MRQATATDRYKMVNEGQMSKNEFVRQMRLEFPQFVTQWNGYDDSIQILKNKGMIFETGVNAYDQRQELNLSLDAIDRGTRYECEKANLDAETCDKAEFEKCKQTAITNLKKNPLHYIDLISGESNKVNKHDRETEVKRGEAATDTLNGMKKAELREEAAPKKPRMVKESTADGLRAIKAKYGTIPGFANIFTDFMNMHGEDIAAGADPLDEFEQYITANYDSLSESEKKVQELKDVEDGRDIGGKIIEFADGGNVDINIDYQRGKTKDFKDVPVEKAIDIVNQYIDQNDLTQASTDETNRILQVDDGDTAIDITKAGMSEKKVQELKDVEDGRDIGGKIIEFADGGNVDINIDYQRGKTKDFKDVPVEKAIDIVNQYIDQNDLTQASTDETNRILQVDDGDTAIDITKAGMSEKKGKDHDGDGDVDGDDYMAAKDKAIKGAMGKDEVLKEAIKKVITKVLSEAYTNGLQRFIDNDSDDEVQTAAKDLMGVIESIENDFLKHKDKIKDAYEKAGPMMAPALEKAFKGDLNSQRVSFETIELPKTPRLTPDQITQIDQQRGAGDLDEKETVFKPNNE